jgi:hypothetical protein
LLPSEQAMTDSRPLFGTPFLSDVMDFERAGNSVLLDRLPLRRHGHDIDRTQYATRRKISAHSPRLRRHLRLSRHRNYNRHHRKTRVSVSLLSVLHAPERTRLSLRMSDESQRLWLQVCLLPTNRVRIVAERDRDRRARLKSSVFTLSASLWNNCSGVITGVLSPPQPISLPESLLASIC